MMARSSKAPSIGRIQMRKTNFSKSSLSACNARPVHTDGQTRHFAPPKTGWDASAWSLPDTERRLRRSVPTLGNPGAAGAASSAGAGPVADISPTCASPLSLSAIEYGGIQRGLKKAPGKALQMEAMSGAPSQLLRCGSVPQLRKLVVNEARAFLVPEFSASEYCRGCSTAGTISGRTLYQIVDVEDGTRSPAPPPFGKITRMFRVWLRSCTVEKKKPRGA